MHTSPDPVLGIFAYRYVLASSSPQRRTIFEQLGLNFRIAVPPADETDEGEPAVVVMRNSLAKAESVVAGEGETVVGVDTIVFHEGKVVGKPSTSDEAFAMVSSLAGRTHTVFSGLTVIHDGTSDRDGSPSGAQTLDFGNHGRTTVTQCTTTEVTFRDLSDLAISDYIVTGEWEGRAGGYAIQGAGALNIAGISGCYFNVVGFPVALFADIMDSLEYSSSD